MIVKTKCKLNNRFTIDYNFLKMFDIQNREIRNKKRYEENKENLKNGNVWFRLNIDVRR